MRDLTIVFALLAGMIIGSVAAIHASMCRDAIEMAALRVNVEPALTKLFARAGTP